MFLDRLMKEEKVAFLELAHHIARSDNDFTESQKSIIAKYCIEMQIDDIEYNDDKFNLDHTLSNIKDTISQKIVLLEVMALINSDNTLHTEEKRILDSMINKFGISQSLAIVYGEWAKSILALYIQAEALLDL